MSRGPVYVLLHQIIQVCRKHIRESSVNTKICRLSKGNLSASIFKDIYLRVYFLKLLFSIKYACLLE